jgi:hypothetical protein
MKKSNPGIHPMVLRDQVKGSQRIRRLGGGGVVDKGSAKSGPINKIRGMGLDKDELSINCLGRSVKIS